MAEMKPSDSLNYIYLVFEMAFGLYFSIVFFQLLWSYRRFVTKTYIGLEVEDTH